MKSTLLRRLAGRPLSALGAAAGATALGCALDESQRRAQAAGDPLDQYKVGPVLGQGAFAIVKLVTSKLSGEEFALKLIDKRWTKTSAMELELSVLKAVGRHRNVVSMIDHFELPSAYGVVLELATGGEVFDRVCERGTYSERDAAALVRQVGGALQHVHSAQVVHRDIKPENLLHVDTSDHAAVKLCDFGLSVFYGKGRRAPTSTAGTVAYMAPEMIREREYGPEVDLWAVGVVLFILLGGYHPFDPDGLADDKRMVKEIKAGNWSFDDPVWKEVSAEAKAVVKGLLAPSPQQRPTATQLLALPWVRGDTASDAQLSTAAAQLRTFNEARRTWRAAAAAAAMVARGAPDAPSDAATGAAGGPLSEETVEEMRVAFNAFDEDGSGSIETSELAQALARMGMGDADAKATMRRIDANSDGTISFAEFCTAMAPLYSDNTRMLKRAFVVFDVDGSGYIDKEELSLMLSKLCLAPQTPEALDAIFRAADTNGDNNISFDEFVHILSHKQIEKPVRSATWW